MSEPGALGAQDGFRQRHVVIAAVGVVLVAVIALVVSRVTGSEGAITSGSLPPEASIALLRQPQTPQDQLPAKLAGSVRLDSAHFLGSTPLGRHYVAVDTTGHMTCLVTLGPGNQAAQAGCSPKNAENDSDPWLEVGSRPGDVVALLPDGAAVPAGMTSVSKNLAFSQG